MATDEAYVSRTAQQISGGIAQRLGIAEPPNIWRAFYAQVANETGRGDPSSLGVKNNNPLNLRPIAGGWPGQIGISPEGFAIFGTHQSGVNAAVQNYLAPDYSGVLEAFRSGDPKRTVMAIEESPWDAGHYGGNLSSFAPSGGGPNFGNPWDFITSGGHSGNPDFGPNPARSANDALSGQGSLVNVTVPGFQAVGDFFSNLGGLFEPTNWWRAGLVIGGFVSIFIGARLYLGQPTLETREAVTP